MSRPPAPLPQKLESQTRRQAGLLSTAQLVAAGVSQDRVKTLLGKGVIARRVRGVYEVPKWFPAVETKGDQINLHRVQTAVTGVLAHGPSAIASGLPALVLAGVNGAPQELTPEIVRRCGSGAAKIANIRVRRMNPFEGSVNICYGIPVLPIPIALSQAIREVDRFTAVSLIDSARSSALIGAKGLQWAKELVKGQRGAAKVKSWWAQSDSRSESPAETWARQHLADAGPKPDQLQLKLFNIHGRFLARVDMAWKLPDSKWLLGEIDGVDFHQERRDVYSDLRRQNSILQSGFTILRWTGSQVRTGEHIAAIRHFLASAGWQAGAIVDPELHLP